MLALDIDFKEVMKDLKKLALVSGKKMQHLAYDEMRMWANDLIKSFQPFKGQKGLPSGSPKKGMEKRIEAMRGAFYPVFPRVKGNNMGAMTTNAIVRVHRDQRKGGAFKLRKHRSGKIEKPIVHARDLDRAVRIVQKEVGKFKAHWIPIAKYYARKSRGKVKAPQWVSRHAGSGRGSIQDTLKANGNGNAIGIAFFKYVKAPGMVSQTMAQSQRVRKRHILKATKAEMRKLIKEGKFHTIASRLN